MNIKVILKKKKKLEPIEFYKMMDRKPNIKKKKNPRISLSTPR